jgi:regulator of sigma E protease
MFSNVAFSALAFIIALGLLIAIHEYGHFWVARRVGIKVLRFSIGFGKALWTKKGKVDDTEYTIAAIPLGGYVKMLDERVEPVAASERHRSFNQQSLAARTAVVIAGPMANFILAILAYWLVMMIGISGVAPLIGPVPDNTPAAVGGFENEDKLISINGTKTPSWNDARIALLDGSINASEPLLIEVETADGQLTSRMLRLDNVSVLKESGDPLEKMGFSPWWPKIDPVVGQVFDGTAASAAGIQAGDRVMAVDQQPIETWQDFVVMVQPSAGKTLLLTIQRNNSTIEVPITPQAHVINGQTIGRIGVSESQSQALFDKARVTVQYSPIVAFKKALQRTWDMSKLTLQMLGKLVVGQASLDNISGPISIAQFAGQSASIGIDHYINFIAMISISLAVLNLLPIPMLDGGHLMYFAIEAITRKPVSERVQILGQQLGLCLLGGLMFLAFYNDIWRLMQ